MTSPRTMRDALTPREREVLVALVEHGADKRVARVLGISHRTVETHRQRVAIKRGNVLKAVYELGMTDALSDRGQ